MRFLPVIFVTILFLPFSAQAGFEWLPNTQATDIERAYEEPSQLPDVMAVPAAPVSQMPVQQNRQQIKNLSGDNMQRPVSKTGLHIDPYPLRSSDSAYVNVDPSATEQALVEQGGSALTPVQLGAGLTTGVKPYHGQPRIQTQANIPVPPRPSKTAGLTPIPGGEPAPLANIEDMYRGTTSIDAMPQQFSNAVGFGKDLPMALALSQVIPEGYIHSFASDVDAGSTVSWEGGKPWDVVLNDMLRPKNLTAVIRGKQVTIQPMAKL